MYGKNIWENALKTPEERKVAAILSALSGFVVFEPVINRIFEGLWEIIARGIVLALIVGLYYLHFRK